ncbi:DNA-binding protein [Streptomyces mayteni]
MAVPRRAVLLSGMAGLSFAALAPAPDAVAMPSAPTPEGPNPIEHFQVARRVLIQADNLLGPRHIMATVQRSIERLRALRRNASGQDARALLELQVRYGELAGWFAQDLGQPQQANTWTDRALHWAHVHGDPDLISYVLGRRSQLAADTGDHLDTLDLAEAAQRDTPPRSRLHAIAEVRRAHGLALRGRESDALRAYDQVLELVDALDDPGPWGSWLDARYVRVHLAHSLHVLGRHSEAAEGFRVAIRALPVAYRRDRGVYLARQAQVYASIGEPEQAAVVGMEALVIAAETGSARIITELAALERALVHRWRGQPRVVELRNAIDRIVYHHP